MNLRMGRNAFSGSSGSLTILNWDEEEMLWVFIDYLILKENFR